MAWQRLAEREQKEWELADVILCPSNYVLMELSKAGVPPHKLRLVPYGVSSPLKSKVEAAIQDRRARPRDKLRVLFAGKIWLGKGILDLISAAQKLGNRGYQFVAAGNLTVDPRHLPDFRASILHLGNLSPDELTREYIRADCFILPSYLEGSATVAYEALAWGLPVVTTHSSGTVVEDGLSGFVGGAGDVNFMVSSLRRLRDERGLLERMGANAWNRSLSFTLEEYKARLLGAISTIS